MSVGGSPFGCKGAGYTELPFRCRLLRALDSHERGYEPSTASLFSAIVIMGFGGAGDILSVFAFVPGQGVVPALSGLARFQPCDRRVANTLLVK